jgi:hypothetical protein
MLASSFFPTDNIKGFLALDDGTAACISDGLLRVITLFKPNISKTIAASWQTGPSHQAT